MGIVASLAAIPIAEDVVRDEKRRELQKCLEEEERLRRLKLGEYRQGDLDLELIKRWIYISGVTGTRIRLFWGYPNPIFPGRVCTRPYLIPTL